MTSRVFCLISAAALLFPQTTPLFRNPDAPLDQRVEDLVSRMTLDEKIAQMSNDAPAIPRLGVPAHNWWNECLHGVARAGRATVFPQAIGLAATWDTEFLHKTASAISDEARAKHHEFARRGKFNIYQGLTFWTPNINLFRDPRWGRGMETYGEDPYLTGKLAVAFIKGLQGDDPKYLKVVATAKHYAVHSGPESERHTFDARVSERDLVESYLPHFEMAVKEGGAWSVMCAYNRVDGDAACASPRLLGEILRKQWGFSGYVVSDCGAIDDIYKRHKIVPALAEAAALSVKAGTDLNCGVEYAGLRQAVERGLIAESEIDTAVRRLFTARFRLGMFDPPERVKYARIPYSVNDSAEHRQLALEAARKSIVLLKNDSGLLPLKKSIKTLAVIGPNANDPEVMLANYNGDPSEPITPLEGIRRKLGRSARVIHARGSDLAAGMPTFETIPASALFQTNAPDRQPGLKGEYYNTANFSGARTRVRELTYPNSGQMVGVVPQNPQPLFTRVDATVAFRWWDGAPRSDMNDDDFGVRWTGYLAPPVTGEYRLGAIGFNAFELYLDEKRIARFNNIHERGYEYAQVKLEAGKLYALRLDFHHFVNDADIRLVWQKPGEDLGAEAMDAVRQAEAVVMFLGLSPRLEGEEMRVPVEGFSGGDRVTLSLPRVQEELLGKVLAAGKPVVLVLMNGSAVAVRQARDKVPAIIEAWYPGQAGGAAIADVLFGDYNPGGRLPVTFYESEAQLPPFNNYDMAGRTYRFFKGEPLFAFGHGLSYTRFTYSNLKLPASARAGEKLAVSVDVRNAGSMAGDEVVQAYLRQVDAPATAPLRTLVGFRRIGLRPGERRSVSFSVELPRTPAAGAVEVSVGGQQPSARVAPTTQVLTGRVQVGGSERAAAGDLKVSVYATAGGVQRHLSTPEARQRAAEALRKIGATRIVLEGRRGDESVAPEALRELRVQLSMLGFETSGGIATVPGKSFGVRQQGGLSWLNWEAEATRKGVAEFFSSNARVFDELVVDDFYCTMDTSPESEKARAGRDWGEYRRDLLTGLIKPVMIEPARAANPRVRMVIKYPQWYDRFHLFGYDPARMSGCFDRVWVGTEVRNPKTQRMGFVQPTQGYINYRWLADLAGAKVEAAWFDHIECTAQNFVDQAWQSVLAGARELVLFNLMDVVSGHPGHELFVKALPEMRAVSRRIQGRPPDGVAYYKPAGSDPGENLFLMDYLAMLGIPVVPVATYPASYRSVVLGVQAAHDPKLLDKVKAHLKSGARVAMTAGLMERLKAPEGVVRLELKTFSEQDYRDAGEWLLPPKELAWLDMPREKADALRKSLGVDLSAPPRIAYYRFGQEEAFYSFLDEDAQVTLRGRAVKAPAHSLAWVGR